MSLVFPPARRLDTSIARASREPKMAAIRAGAFLSRFTSCSHTGFAPTASEEQLSMPDRPLDPELPNAQHECLVLAAGLLRGVTDRGCHTDGFAVRKLRAHSRIVLSCEYVPNAYRFPDCVALHETKFVPRNNVRSPVHSVLHLWLLPKRTPSKGPRA